MSAFGGWDMPIEYSSIMKEHLAVRSRAGLFDVSHMGEIEIRGPGSLALVQQVACNDASRLRCGQIQYSALLTEQGTFVDDVLVHRFGESRFLLCVNAGNTDKDYRHICRRNRFGAEVNDVSDQYAQLAIQGPRAAVILQPLVDLDLATIRTYRCRQGLIQGVSALIARTGYTGEDGFEVYLPPGLAESVWNSLSDLGRPEGMLPAGLGARNTLRLEAKMALYGHEISEQTTPWEAGLGWMVCMDKEDFTGKSCLAAQLESGVQKKLIGFEMRGPGIGRDGYRVFSNGRDIGWVTSGSPAPFLKKNIGLAYVKKGEAFLGNRLDVQVRQRLIPAEVVETPFYKRKKPRPVRPRSRTEARHEAS
jgi:aminomethyltransferase